MSGIALVILRAVQLAGWAGLLLGTALLIAPRPTLRLSNAFGRYDPFAWLDRRHFMERFFYRHHRVFGFLITAGAIYASYFLATQHLDGELMGASLSDALLANAIRFLWVANLILILFGLVVFARPSLLKTLESKANRWFELRLPEELGEKTRTVAERLRGSPRLSGLLLCAGGLYLVTFVSVL